MTERLTLFFRTLKTTVVKAKTPITLDIMKEFRELNEALNPCCQLALRQPLPGETLVLMTDASFQSAGYAVLIEDDLNQKYTSTRKIYARVAYGSKTYTPSHTKMIIYAKELLIIPVTFKDFKHTFRGATKPVIILSDGESVTKFLSQKYDSSVLKECLRFLLQFNFTIAHTPGKRNTAAAFLMSFGNGS